MNIEKPFLAAFFILMLFLGISNLWDHKIAHEFPYAYLASDAFQQQTRAEGIKDAGNYRQEPFYVVKGFEGVIGYYPPIMHHVGILLHFSSGIPLYDTVYFMVFFNAILAAFVMYIIIRSYNKHIALLSLPLSILIFSSKSYIGFLWGHWASITGQLFLIAVFWSMRRIFIEKAEYLLAIFMASLALAHTSELIYGVIFVAAYSLILIVYKKFDRAYFKKIAIAAAISFIISIYSIYIFANSFMVTNPYEFRVSKDWGGTPIFYITDFGLLLIFMAVGFIASLFLFKKMDVAVLAGAFMLLVGYANYIGFGIRAYQPRLFWPIYLSLFFGLGLYLLVKFVPQKLRFASVIGIAILTALALSNAIQIPNIPAYNKLSTPGLMDKGHWDAFQWISQNTQKDAKVYFFYGDTYNQDAILRNSERTHAQVTPEEFIEALQNRTIKRVYLTDSPADHGAGMPYYKSFLKIGLRLREEQDYWLMIPKIDVCLFNYFVFDKASRQPVLAQYNLLIANEMLKKNAEVAFENDAVIVLKNNNVGGDCIEQINF